MIETQSSDTFKFTLPVDLQKSKDGDWKIRGLASTAGKDQQNENILQAGMDLTPIDMKKGVINYDHEKGPENTIGVLDGYAQTPNGLYLEGRLFKNHTKAKAVHQIISSLKEEDHGRMGMSVEGAILKRNKDNPNIIEKCRINAVALTMNPVNSSTYVDLVKSMNASPDFGIEATISTEDEFSSDDVLELLDKALGLSSASIGANADKTGGDALQPRTMGQQDEYAEHFDEEELVKQKKLKKMSKSQFKKSLIEVLENMQILHPDCSRSELWNALHNRMEKTFPVLEKSARTVTRGGERFYAEGKHVGKKVGSVRGNGGVEEPRKVTSHSEKTHEEKRADKKLVDFVSDDVFYEVYRSLKRDYPKDKILVVTNLDGKHHTKMGQSVHWEPTEGEGIKIVANISNPVDGEAKITVSSSNSSKVVKTKVSIAEGETSVAKRILSQF